MNRRGRRGIALMLVLWLIVVLGTIAASVTALARSEANAAGNARARSVARYAAESGVVAGTQRLGELLRAARNQEEQIRIFADLGARFRELQDEALGDALFSVTAADLNARVDLNVADEPILVGLFSQFTSAREAEGLASRLADWKDEDEETRAGGAEKAQYERAGSPYTPANAPFARLEEVARVEGFEGPLADAVAPYVTVWGDGRININSAPEQVLAAVPGMGDVAAREIVERRSRGEVFTAMPSLESLRSQRGDGLIDRGYFWIVPRRILLVSRGWRRGHPLTHEVQAVFEVDGARLRLRHWQERDL